MDELPYALSEEDFVRMANAVRRVEGLPPRRDSQAFNRAAVEENPHAWIKITSAIGSTVTLGGGTVTGYAAVWGYFDSGGTGFVWTTNTAWFVPAPGSPAPTVNAAFDCRLLGVDASGVPIWGADISSGTQSYSAAYFTGATATSVPSGLTYTNLTITGGTTVGDTDNYGPGLLVPVDAYYSGFFVVNFPPATADYWAAVQGPISQPFASGSSGGTHNHIVQGYVNASHGSFMGLYCEGRAQPPGGFGASAFQLSGSTLSVQLWSWGIHRVR